MGDTERPACLSITYEAKFVGMSGFLEKSDRDIHMKPVHGRNQLPMVLHVYGYFRTFYFSQVPQTSSHDCCVHIQIKLTISSTHWNDVFVNAHSVSFCFMSTSFIHRHLDIKYMKEATCVGYTQIKLID